MKRLIFAILAIIPSLCCAADYSMVVATPFGGQGTPGDPYVPAMSLDYGCSGWSDVTNYPVPVPSPNVYLVEFTCSEELTAIIIRDGSYPVISSRATTDPINTQPKETKVNLDKLVTDLKALGVTDAHLSATALADTSKADVTGQDVSIQLRDVMSKFPAAVKPK